MKARFWGPAARVASLCTALAAAALTAAQPAIGQTAQAPKADSKDALFGDVAPAASAETPADQNKRGWTGYVAGELARDYKSPQHWSNARLRAEVARQGQFNSNVKWKISARAEYDAAYDRS